MCRADVLVFPDVHDLDVTSDVDGLHGGGKEYVGAFISLIHRQITHIHAHSVASGDYERKTPDGSQSLVPRFSSR